MLSERLGLLQSYLQGVTTGELPPNRALLRQISAVANSVPVTDAPKFDHQMAKELDDAMLTTYLATLTSGLEAVHDLVARMPPTDPKAGSGGSGGGGGAGGFGGFGEYDERRSMGVGMGGPSRAHRDRDEGRRRGHGAGHGVT